LKMKYGLTLEEYAKKCFEQNNQCAICGGPPNKHGLYVDHCHKTQKVRGLICNFCNVGIGQLKDDYKIVEKAAQYLKSFDEDYKTMIANSTV
jgi:hypothetical protein